MWFSVVSSDSVIVIILNPALISIAEKISQALHQEAYWGRTQSEGETKSSHNDSTHSEVHSSLGLSRMDCTVLYPQRLLVTRGGLERYFWVTSQGRKPRPGLVSLHKIPGKTFPSTAGSPRPLWTTEWVESLWLLSVSPALWVLPQWASWWSAWDIFCWKY